MTKKNSSWNRQYNDHARKKIAESLVSPLDRTLDEERNEIDEPDENGSHGRQLKPHIWSCRKGAPYNEEQCSKGPSASANSHLGP